MAMNNYTPDWLRLAHECLPVPLLVEFTGHAIPDKGWFHIERTGFTHLMTHETGFGCVPKNNAPVLLYRFYKRPQRGVSAIRSTCWLYDLAHRHRRDLPVTFMDSCIPHWSPDGDRIVFCESFPVHDGGRGRCITVYDINCQSLIRDTKALQGYESQVMTLQDLRWAPNSQGIYMVRSKAGSWLIERMTIESGVISAVHYVTLPDDVWPARLSPDCTKIAYIVRTASASILQVLHLVTRETVVIGRAEARRDPIWSPNSREIAYYSFSREATTLCIADTTLAHTTFTCEVNSGDDLGHVPPLQPIWLTSKCLLFASIENGDELAYRIALGVPGGESSTIATTAGGFVTSVIGVGPMSPVDQGNHI